MSKLDLRDTKVGLFSIDISADNIASMDLRGFQYETIADPESKIEAPEDVCSEANIFQCLLSKWHNFLSFLCEKKSYGDKTDYYLGLLNKVDLYSPQPYKQLASALTKNGHDEQARNILYESRKAEMIKDLHERNLFNAFIMSLQFASSGYGHRYWITIVVTIGLLALGASLVRALGEGEEKELSSIIFSFDRLIPFVRLYERHSQIVLKHRFLRWYFYFHQIAGYVLGSFIVAGLAGLTE